MKLRKNSTKRIKVSLVRSANALKLEANRKHTQGVIDFLRSCDREIIAQRKIRGNS